MAHSTDILLKHLQGAIENGEYAKYHTSNPHPNAIPAIQKMEMKTEVPEVEKSKPIELQSKIEKPSPKKEEPRKLENLMQSMGQQKMKSVEDKMKSSLDDKF